MSTITAPPEPTFEEYEAAYWYFVNNHDGQGSLGYAALCALLKVFRPGMFDEGPRDPEAKRLVKKWERYGKDERAFDIAFWRRSCEQPANPEEEVRAELTDARNFVDEDEKDT